MDTREDYLKHYGILGMHWGIRRYQNKDGTLTNAGKKRLSKLDAERNKLIKDTSDESSSSKKVTELSNAELQERIERINLEKKYSELINAQNAKKVSKGKKFVADVFESAGKNIATQTLTYIMGKGVNKMFEKAGFGSDIVNPKKGQKDK